MLSKRNLVILYIVGFVYSGTMLSVNGVIDVTVAIMAERSSVDIPFNINRSTGILELAFEKAQEIVNQTGRLTFMIRNIDQITCSEFKVGASAAEAYHKHNAVAFIGPGCSNAVEVVARLAAAWKVPHITYGGTSTNLGNKTEFETLTRLAYTMDDFAKFYIRVFDMFRWKDIANIYDASSFLTWMIGNSLQNSFLKAGVRSYELPFSSVKTDRKEEYLRVLTTAMGVSRVFLVACHGSVLRQLAILATQLGMEPGEYTIIYFISDPTSANIGNYNWEIGDQYDEMAKAAYESVMIVIPRRPYDQAFLEFERTVIERAWTDYGYRWAEGSEIGLLQFAQYDSVVVYAHALKIAVEKNVDPRDGKEMMKLMWNRTYQSIGGKLYVNEHGNRDTDCSLMDLDPDTGKFHTVVEYLGYTGSFGLLPDTPIHWPNDAGPTPNMPKCGFLGEFCRTFSFPTYGIVVIAFAMVILLLIFGGILILRRIKAEAAIQSQWWKIKWEDLIIEGTSNVTFSSSRNSVSSQSGITRAAITLSVGVYKGIPVHIRRLKLKSLPIDRKLLLELKEMRDVNCPNLTRLIGVCPESTNVCIITEFCSRGNLQDILHQESMQLDGDFRLSLINDIIQITNFGLRSVDDNFLEVSETNTDTIKQIKANRPKPRRPSFGNDNSFPEIFKMAEECWREKPEERPTFSDLKKKILYIRRDNPHGNNVLDMLLHRMEKYANNLEGLVEEKTKALFEEKKRTEELLYEVLPKSVADQLKIGTVVIPEAYEMVTVYFSDIVGFTSISAVSTPLQVVDFLNDVYICFDGIIANFDVYKVETIGDAYMVVSGLPVKNKNEHVRQISRMSLSIVEHVQKFVIRHQPDTPLRARIGIHSGPVVAGVVGQKMPRYCLFGDTVNTASRMESNGLPMRIHISDSTRNLLETFRTFIIEERGIIELKGKGPMLTHWLVEEVQCSDASQNKTSHSVC